MAGVIQNGQIISHPKMEELFGTRVVMRDRAAVQRKIKQFQQDGKKKISVISDFDFTMSKFHVQSNQRGASCFKVLEDCDFLGLDYKVNAQAIQRHYYPLEVDPTLDEDQRVFYMIEWVTKAVELLREHKLTSHIIEQSVKDALDTDRFELRPKLLDFLTFSNERGVPVLIFSAGIADVLEDLIKYFLPIEAYPDLYIISNRCIFDEETKELKDMVQPLIHVFNKKSAAFLHTPFFNRPDRHERRNVLLLGDSLGDVSMTEGMEEKAEEKILKIGFLSDRLERLPSYLDSFDIVLLDDPGFDVPYGILQAICETPDKEIL